MAKDDHVEFEGKIINCGAGGHYRVEVNTENETDMSHIIIAKLSGKMRKNRIRVVLGDSVTVAVSTYDLSRGIITFRKK